VRADKRKVTSREEMQRIFQAAGLIHADEVPARGMNAADIDMDYFKKYFQKQYGESIDDQEIPLNKLLENMDLMKDGIFNLAGTGKLCLAPKSTILKIISSAVIPCSNALSIISIVFLLSTAEMA
jgi:ATP-dependent DNA helicase RecG